MTTNLTEYQNSKKRKLESVSVVVPSSISPTLINESTTVEENKKKKINSSAAPLNQNIMLVVYENLFKKIVQPYCNFKIPILENSSNFTLALAPDNANHNFCHWYAILAIGAEFAGNLINAEQYIEKARIYAQPVDNLNYNYTTALDYILLLIYYFLFEKGGKTQANKYISSLLEICLVIRTKKCLESEHNVPEIELLAYNIQFFISQENKINVCKTLRNMESIRAKVLSTYFVAEEALKLTPNFEIYNAALQKILEMDLKLEQYRSQFTALEYINCISTSKAIQSVLYYSIGFKELALTCANNAYVTLVQELEMQEYNLMWWQVRLVEYIASVHLNLQCKNNVLLDISLLEKCAKAVSCPDLVVELLPNLREQLSQIMVENISFLDSYQENSLFNNAFTDTNFLFPSDLALTTLLDDESNQFLSDDSSSSFSDLWRQDIGGLYTDFDEPNSRTNVEQYSFPCDFITG